MFKSDSYPTRFESTRKFDKFFIPINTIHYYLYKKNVIKEKDRNDIINNIKSYNYNSISEYGQLKKPIFFDIEATGLPCQDSIITEIGFENYDDNGELQFIRVFLDLSKLINRRFSSYKNNFDSNNIVICNSLIEMENYICSIIKKETCIIGNNIISDIEFLKQNKMFKLLSLIDIENSIDQSLFNKFLKIYYNSSYDKEIRIPQKLHTTIECYNIFKKREEVIKKILLGI